MSHPFEPDPDVPPDYGGRAYCRCGLPASALHVPVDDKPSTEEDSDDADR